MLPLQLPAQRVHAGEGGHMQQLVGCVGLVTALVFFNKFVTSLELELFSLKIYHYMLKQGDQRLTLFVHDFFSHISCNELQSY